uniref:Probable pyruvate dehydrogenase E1 component subunit alpha, mitochondrial-like n=1 Tax=Saccoglossus kowalevskii TaxID=10224 RepID=A0ABM0MX40_SACKO
MIISTIIRRLGRSNPAKRSVCLITSTRNYSDSPSALEASFTTKGYKLHKLDEGPSTEVTVTREDALTYYRQMQTIRRMEAAAGNLYKAKVIRGFCHLYSGQ